MNEKEKIVFKIAEEIEKLGGRAYFVGGMVRDKIMGKDFHDYDIEVYGLTKDKLEELLLSFANFKSVGKTFSIFTLEKYDLDIAMPRKDIKVANGHKGFEVISDPFMSKKDAASRRDFTCNALMQDVLSGEIFDYFNGYDDIKHKILRHVSSKHFGEDPLRVLRACRFKAQLDFTIAEETIKIANNTSLADLSIERIQEEFKKALNTNKPSFFFEALKEMNHQKLFYELKDIPYFIDDKVINKTKYQNPYLYLVANLLLAIKEEDRISFLNKCNSSKEFQKEALKWAKLASNKASNLFDLYEEVKYPDDFASFYEERYSLNQIDEYHNFLKQDFVSGNDLLALGYKPGKEFRIILDKARKLQYTLNKSEVLDVIKSGKL